MDMTKITTDFNATESASTVQTRLSAMATFYGSAAAYSTWGDARADLNGYIPVAQAINNFELASGFIDKLNDYANVPSVHWDDAADTYKKKAAGTNVTSVHAGMKRCVLNADGSVNYYLDPTDSTQKEAGGAADLTGADGNVMVEIPKFWFHHELSGGKNQWRISPTALPGYTLHPAFVKAGVEVDHRYIGAYDACLKFSRSITAVADAGGGDITLTTSAQHPLYAGDSVTISGTTSYDGTYIVVTRASNTTFTVTAAFVATETGTAAGYVSGKNLDSMAANVQTGVDSLASVSGQYPLVALTRAQNRTIAANNGTGWHQLDFALWSAIQMLYLVEYGTFDSQSVLGDGNTGFASYPDISTAQTNSPHSIAGKSNALGNASTDATSGASSASRDTAFMAYRGIENLYGNSNTWCDGINVNEGGEGRVHVTNDYTNFADGTTSGFTLISSSFPTASGFIRNILNTGAYFLSSTNSGGSSSTFLTDQHFANANASRVVRAGGSAVADASGGAFCLFSTTDASIANRATGARLAF
jgi:hypothetical protein